VQAPCPSSLVHTISLALPSLPRGFLILQAVPLADDPSAWPGLPGGRSGNATGNSSSAETSENESEAAALKIGKLGVTMADKIARASSTPAVKKEEGKKKLTTLNGRTKQTAGEAQAESLGAKSAPTGTPPPSDGNR
jgi:hypothetical protein